MTSRPPDTWDREEARLLGWMARRGHAQPFADALTTILLARKEPNPDDDFDALREWVTDHDSPEALAAYIALACANFPTLVAQPDHQLQRLIAWLRDPQ